MKVCPRCFKTDAEIGNCGNHAVGCPTPRLVNEATDVVVSCQLCNLTVAVPVEKIMQGKIRSMSGKCLSDRCKAILLTVRPAKAKTGRGDGTKSEAPE